MTPANPELCNSFGAKLFATILADPPWQFINRTGKIAVEHRRLTRYDTMTLPEICALPVADILTPTAHLSLWVLNALLAEGLEVMHAWGFAYTSNIVWHRLRRDGGSDGGASALFPQRHRPPPVRLARQKPQNPAPWPYAGERSRHP